MQIIYMGPNWMPGQELLLYSPTFRGKKGELGVDTDSTLQASPIAELLVSASDTTTTPVGSSMSTSSDISPFDSQGHLSAGFIAQRRLERRREVAQERKEKAQNLKELSSGYRLRIKRAQISQDVLTKALNETATDGWEIMHVLSYGDPGQGRLLYVLKHY